MEEARLDHGIDRLPFFALLLFLFSSLSFATSFGPMTISNQVDTARYFVRGQIAGPSWVQEERNTKRPFTYWKLSVSAEPKGGSLEPTIIIRQPGGELGGMGYHVAGSATFREGEEIFVALRDTDEPAKEVIGLASGKYTVERDANGNPVVKSGLGFTVENLQGRPFHPDDFAKFVQKIARGQASEAERALYLNKSLTHDHSPEVDRGVEEVKRLRAEAGSSNAAPATGGKPTVAVEESSVQESAAPAEEPTGSSSTVWILGGATVLLLGLGFWLSRRR